MDTERIKVTIIAETEKAYQVSHMVETVWIPKSQIQKMTRTGDDAEMVVPAWLYKDKFGE